MYYELMKNGWSLSEIDEMDIHFYLSILEHMNNKKEKEENEEIFIDQLKW